MIVFLVGLTGKEEGHGSRMWLDRVRGGDWGGERG